MTQQNNTPFFDTDNGYAWMIDGFTNEDIAESGEIIAETWAQVLYERENTDMPFDEWLATTDFDQALGYIQN